MAGRAHVFSLSYHVAGGCTFFQAFTWPGGRTFSSFHVARRAHVFKFSRGREGARFEVFTWPGGRTFSSFHVARRAHVF